MGKKKKVSNSHGDQGIPSAIIRSPTNRNLNGGGGGGGGRKNYLKKFFNWLLMVKIHKNADKDVEHLAFIKSVVSWAQHCNLM